MSSVKKAIKIYARLKPLQSDPFPYDVEEIDAEDTQDEILVLGMKSGKGQEENYYTHTRPIECHRFRYSKIFDRKTEQAEVFGTICKPVLESALSGYNGTVFAYGQTGSGKTFTMSGSRTIHEHRGIIPRSLSYIFEKLQDLDNGIEVQGISISYLEIYNENGYDLLHNGFISGKLDDLRKVALMEDGNQKIHLKNLSVHPVSSEEEAMHYFYLGEHNRTIAETPMNEASTRSHCIFSIYLSILERKSSVVRKSKVHLVDLAGSERISNTNVTGQLFNEARHINLALHYLEQVIVALGESNRSHIPYRNSMMTSILRDSLGGNCMTSMIATLSLEPKNIPESLSTCRFSQRVALVTNDAAMNEEIDQDLLIAQLKAEIKRLKYTINNSTIKPTSDSAAPLNQEELTECWTEVQRYLEDPDDASFLNVTPDMRLVQVCFRCLKYAVDKANANKTINLPPLPSGELPHLSAQDAENPTVRQLLTMLKNRDEEIRLLTTEELPANKAQKKKSSTPLIKGGAPRAVKVVGSMDNCSRSVRSSTNNNSNNNAYQPPPLPISVQQMNGDILSASRTRTNEGKGTTGNFQLPDSTSAIIDKEVHLLDGLSDAKKAALDCFMASYSEKSKLSDARNELIRKRSVVQNIEEDMKAIQANLNQLKRVMMNSNVDNESNNYEVFKNAYETQKQNLQNNEIRFLNAKKYTEDSEIHLKTIYHRLMTDFQSWWDKQQQNCTENASLPISIPGGKTSPMKNVATGVFKRTPRDELWNPIGVKSSSHPQYPPPVKSSPKLPLSLPSGRMKSGGDCVSFVNSPGSLGISGRKTAKSKLSKRKSGREKETLPPDGSDDDDDDCPGFGLKLFSNRSIPRGPCRAPHTSPEDTPKIEIKSPTTTKAASDLPIASPNKSQPISVRSPIIPSVPLPIQNVHPPTIHPTDEIMNNLPMTGDPETDLEILNFFRKRQAVFKKLNSESPNQSFETGDAN